MNSSSGLVGEVALPTVTVVRLLTLHDQDELERAEPDTMRFRLYHLPARLTDHARRCFLRIERTWPWVKAFTTCWHLLTACPPSPDDETTSPDETREAAGPHHLWVPWNPGVAAATREGPGRDDANQTGQTGSRSCNHDH
ncbi:hypothetical protein AB0478_34215 [Streptomyces sp. NPDC051917]|uniref:hypothetical protein n=1 Tax=Streptomyces sp. NPDC051917 TaxID=3154754 RepID=UPI003450B8B1